jgi:hypothetical protein
MLGEHLADAFEADFLFKVIRINHWLRILECKSKENFSEQAADSDGLLEDAAVGVVL